MNLEHLLADVKKNKGKYSYDELADKYGVTHDVIRGRIVRAGLKSHIVPYKHTEAHVKKTAKQITAEARLEAKLREKDNQHKVTDKKYKALQEELRVTQAKLEAAFQVKKAPKKIAIHPASNAPEQAVAFMVASDWHVEEEVKRSHNLDNVFNLQIAEERAKHFFSNGLYLTRLAQQHSKIDTLVVPLLGDFITNSLRDENLENNLLQPGEALWFAKSLLVAGIKFLLKESNLKLVFICHSGNHGRGTEKVHIATEYGNSLEVYMYRDIAEYFENEPRCTFIIEEGMMTYYKVFDKTIRFLHGHSIRFAGGVGGVTIPVRKAIAQWNKRRWADLTIMGHFHQMVVMEDFIVNGSLIGHNSFGEFIKADYEHPRQVFFILHKHNGGTKTLISPIWLDKTAN